MKLDYTTMPLYLADYLKYLTLIKLSAERTVEEYFHDIRLFLQYVYSLDHDCPEDLADYATVSAERLGKVTTRELTDFQIYLMDARVNQSRARARKLSAIRGLYSYLLKNKLIDINPCVNLESTSIKKSVPHYLNLEESTRLLDSTEDIRDYCILTLFLNCGMRLSELVGMNLNSVDFQEYSLRLLGKGSKTRVIYFNDACYDAMQNYLAVRKEPEPPSNAFFISRFNKRISKRRVQQIVEDALAAAQLDGKGLSTHKLRHTAATLMYQYGGADALILKEILGHESVATTEIYTHIADSQKRDAINSSPLAGKRQNKKADE